jgi:uncharacterized membrane protein
VRARSGRRIAGDSARTVSLLWRFRLVAFGFAGIAAAAVVLFGPAWLVGTTRAVAAYDAGALILLIVNWTVSLRDDAEHTIRRAAVADPGRNVVSAVVLISIAIGLAAAVAILGHGPSVPAADRNVAVVLGVLAVGLGWFLIHTTFILRYAHLFYFDVDADGLADRGLIFPETEQPDDYDFAYFSFIIGMTFQVSDVQVSSPGMRRVVLIHSLISFAYNTAILALGVNLVSSILNAH